jgi:hypothetical protein
MNTLFRTSIGFSIEALLYQATYAVNARIGFEAAPSYFDPAFHPRTG